MNNTTRRHPVGLAGLRLLGLAVILAVVDLAVKAYATGPSGLRARNIDLGVMQLRLAFNSGVAFSVGADAPDILIIAGTGAVVAGLGVVAWRSAADLPLPARLALGSILGGALANLVDRARDGVVTDYFYTGWWPTFNLADVFIVVGAGATIVIHFVFGDQTKRFAAPDESPQPSEPIDRTGA